MSASIEYLEKLIHALNGLRFAYKNNDLTEETYNILRWILVTTLDAYAHQYSSNYKAAQKKA
ncbi:MAG: hypothetical protein QXV17_10495 [Candidatus Micrarchaeaceae archaeon]